MSVARITRAADPPPRPGEWIPFGSGALLCCPGCGDKFHLANDPEDGHTINASGNVVPSVVCPGEACKWHVHVELAGWGQ